MTESISKSDQKARYHERIFVNHCRVARKVSQLLAVCFQEFGWFTGVDFSLTAYCLLEQFGWNSSSDFDSLFLC